MLRAELDALPVREQTGLPYASTVTATAADGRTVPVMHACGHDMHLACAAGAAAELATDLERWRGTLLVVGQPAEETLQGARAMLADGLYQRFEPPSVVLAQHTAPCPAGLVAHGHGGPMTAGSRTLRVVIHGRGGHAATPHLAIDPVPVAAAIVLRLPGVVNQEVGAAEQAVVTVSSLQAGSSGNVIPDLATLTVTARAFSEHTLDRITATVQRVAQGEALASGCPREPEVEALSSSGVNLPDADLTSTIRTAHQTAFGPPRVTDWPPHRPPRTSSLRPGGPAPARHPRHPHRLLDARHDQPPAMGHHPGTTPAEKLAALPPTTPPSSARTWD